MYNTCVYTYIYIYIYTHIHVRVCVCIYIYIYTHTHNNITCVYIYYTNAQIAAYGKRPGRRPERCWRCAGAGRTFGGLTSEQEGRL